MGKEKKILEKQKKQFTCPYCSKIYKNKNDAHLLKCAKLYKGKKQGILTQYFKARS